MGLGYYEARFEEKITRYYKSSSYYNSLICAYIDNEVADYIIGDIYIYHPLGTDNFYINSIRIPKSDAMKIVLPYKVWTLRVPYVRRIKLEKIRSKI
jgi:hypothetical protein